MIRRDGQFIAERLSYSKERSSMELLSTYIEQTQHTRKINAKYVVMSTGHIRKFTVV